MPFQLNDYVRVKPGVLLAETGEPVPGWEGEITEVPRSTNALVYLVELDALSLEQLPEQYLADCVEQDETPTAYYFGEEDLEPAVRRDTDAQRIAAQARLEAYLFPDEDALDIVPIYLWYSEFEQNPLFSTLEPEGQESAKLIIELFAEYAYNYRGDQAADWTVGTVREVCLELYPRKFTAEIEFFDLVGVVLKAFFAFLVETQHHKKAGELYREINKIAPDIVLRAKDPRNWGMAKSLGMQAFNSGVDMGDAAALNDFMANYSSDFLSALDLPDFGPKKPQNLRPAPENPFKNLSRNQVIKVKYLDGSIREGKFKRLEDDLRTGKCVLC